MTHGADRRRKGCGISAAQHAVKAQTVKYRCCMQEFKSGVNDDCWFKTDAKENGGERGDAQWQPLTLID